MFDSLLRKLNGSSKTRASSSIEKIKSNSSYIIVKPSSHNIAAPNSVSIELEDLTNRFHNNCRAFAESNLTKPPVPSRGDEHIYEEIDDNNQAVHKYCSKSSKYHNHETVINELASHARHKKSVRFNSSQVFQSNELNQIELSLNTSSINCSSFKPASSNSSILKNKRNCDSLALGPSSSSGGESSSSNTSNLSSPQLTPTILFLPISNSAQPQQQTRLNSNVSGSLSSSSSSFGIYTSNSLNSSTNVSIVSSHSHVFNQMVEEFINRIGSSGGKSISNHEQPTSTISNCKNSEQEIPSNGCQKKIDSKLSFRVTNLSLEDLKRRQKLIYMQSLSRNNSSQTIPINV